MGHKGGGCEWAGVVAHVAATTCRHPTARSTRAASVSVALPLLAHVVLRERATAPLRRANAWLTEHNATIMAVVLLAIGALVLTKGVSGL